MTRSPAYPKVDGRRVSDLRSDLLRDIAALAPDWRAVSAETGADRAIVEIAARLAEEATRRLDQTPQRDALAFLELFDVAPPRPSAARGVSVFALKEDNPGPVTAAARTGLEIATISGEAAKFETAEDILIQPTRIGLIATSDPSTDRLEVAPAQVSSFDPDLTPRPAYGLATSAGPGATVISIEPPIGILPGDLLRVERIGAEPVFLEVETFSEDGLATLVTPVGETGLPVAMIAGIERMTRLDAFSMPDQQEHGLYIGDADLLNVNEPATITLRFDPAPIAALLGPNSVEFELWGTREAPGKAEDAPRWHRLVPLAGGAGQDIRLYKSWVGPADELDLGEKKARFIRVRPKDPIVPTDDEHPLTGRDAMLETVQLGIKTEQPADASGDTVSQIAYNGTPLPLTTAFLPFGAEPRRFDTFALAAPEVFTKPGATATLSFHLTDATLASVSAAFRFDGERHAYGVGFNGRLQALILTGERTVWRDLGGPPTEDGSSDMLPLEPNAGAVAYGRSIAGAGDDEASDIVVTASTSGRVFTGRIRTQRDAQASAEDSAALEQWYEMPGLPDGFRAEEGTLALAVAPQKLENSAGYRGFILAAGQGGVAFVRNRYAGYAFTNSNWQAVPLPVDLTVPDRPVLQLIDGSVTDDEALFLTVDAARNVWVLTINLDGTNPVWNPLEDAIGDRVILPVNARPTGFFTGGAAGHLLLGYPADGTLDIWEFDRATGFGYVDDFQSANAQGTTTTTRLRIVPGLETGLVAPHVIGYRNGPGPGEVFEWAPTRDVFARHVPTPDMALDDPPLHSVCAIFPPTSDDPRARVVFPAQDQRFASLHVNPSVRVTDLEHWVAVPAASGAGLTDVLVGFSDANTGDALVAPGLERGKNEAGEEVYAFGGNADWDPPLDLYRAGPTIDVEYEGASPNSGELTGDTGTAPAALIGRTILVRTSQADQNFELFTVAATNDDDVLTVNDVDRLDDLLGNPADGDTETAVWAVVEQVGTVAGAQSGENDNTLAELGNATFPDAIAAGHFFEPGLADSPLLTDTTGSEHAILPDWGGNVPLPNEVFLKLVPQNGGPEILTIHSFSSEFAEPELSWEYYNGDGWKLLDQGFLDTTSDFQRSGKVQFTVPRDLSLTEIGGQEDYWVRARLVAGDYGQPEYKVQISNGGNTQTVEIDTSKLHPPQVASVTAAFDLPVGALPQFVVARNNLRDLDQSSANSLKGAEYAMFEGAFAEPLGAGGSRAIFLGLTRPLEPGSASLFVTALDNPDRGELVLETLGPDNTWAPAPLAEEDPTFGLHRTGLIRFTVTERPAQVFLFGKVLHWLRLRVRELTDWQPQITGIWLNGVRVVQAETVRQELLASSAGEPDLQLTLLKPPVLANSLELRIRERIGAEEIEKLNAEGDQRGLIQVLIDPPNLPGKWVLWRQVDSLQNQSADARVYLLNPDGRLRFGNGRNGRIAPAGRDNIRAFVYQSGGQRVETQAFADTRLTGSVEGLEETLTPSPIAGGTHTPTEPELVARMPEALRHAGSALSLADLEAQARDADSEIVQVRAFAPDTDGGSVRLAVLARSESRMPVYSLAQRENLKRVLAAKMSDAWGAVCLDVQSAVFVPVKVTVRLHARPGGLAALETVASAQLRTFLHAVWGGPGLSGWPPGRALWPTDIRRALSAIGSLDRIESVEIEMPGDRALGEIAANEVITTASSADIRVLVLGEAET